MPMITNIGRTSKSSSLVAERSASSAFRDAGAKCLFRTQSQTLNRVAGGDSSASQRDRQLQCDTPPFDFGSSRHPLQDRKSTRLNSSHQIISYAVFFLKKKKYA